MPTDSLWILDNINFLNFYRALFQIYIVTECPNHNGDYKSPPFMWRPPKQAFFSFPPYQSPSGKRSVSQKRTLAFYIATILAYFGNPTEYRAHLKKLCKSAAFLALFRSPASPFPEIFPSENSVSGPYVPLPIHSPKNSLLSIFTCQRPYEEEIGRPNAAKYGLTFSDVKTPPVPELWPHFCETWRLHRGGGQSGAVTGPVGVPALPLTHGRIYDGIR